MMNDDDMLKYLEEKFDELFGDIDMSDELTDADEVDDMDELLDSTIIMNDENGNEVEFDFLDLIEYEGNEYVVLLPVDDDTDEVVILQVENIEEDEESYISVTDEHILQSVFDIFKEKFKNDFNFTD